jgi:plastocyanin
VGSLVLVLASSAWFACDPPDGQLQPDQVLQSELGLTANDQVHRVTLTGGAAEKADPIAVSIDVGAYVEFITTDWLIHEVLFDRDSLDAAQWAFIERTDQAESPPLLQRDSRYVLSFEGAPPGRYPYSLQGNREPGRGVIVVRAPEVR